MCLCLYECEKMNIKCKYKKDKHPPNKQKKQTKTKQKPIIVAHIVHRRVELLAPQIPP